jgi:hypothetical protein
MDHWGLLGCGAMSWRAVPDVSKDIAALLARVKQQLRNVSALEDEGSPSLRSAANHSRSFRARRSQLLSVTTYSPAVGSESSVHRNHSVCVGMFVCETEEMLSSHAADGWLAIADP